MFEKLGFPLLSRRQYMVSGKFGILALGGTFVGFYYGNLMLSMLGSLLLGAYVSQMFPIWKEFDRKLDNQDMSMIAMVEPLSRLVWIGILILTLVLFVMQLMNGSMPG